MTPAVASVLQGHVGTAAFSQDVRNNVQSGDLVLGRAIFRLTTRSSTG